MPIDLDNLPDDAAELQQMLRTVLLQHSALYAENDQLRLLIQRLTRHQFGRRSEQLSPDQLQLGLENLEQTIAANRRRRRRLQLLRLGLVPGALLAIMARCPRTCRATRWSSTSRTATAHAAVWR